MKILFINACVRRQSRTLQLARHLLKRLEGEVMELNLEEENITPLTRETLEKREHLVREGRLDDTSFQYARKFAEADCIVIAAPFWDLSFPSLLKIYLENVAVPGITFQYVEGIPKGMCHAKKLFYVTTAGGPVFADFGYSYVKFLAEHFYGICETVCFKTENLDVEGADCSALLQQTEKEMDCYFS